MLTLFIILSIILALILGVVILRNNYVNKLRQTSLTIAYKILGMIDGENMELSDDMFELHASKLAGMIEVCVPFYKWLEDDEVLGLFVLGNNEETAELINNNAVIIELKATIEAIKNSLSLAEEPKNNGLYVLEISKQQASLMYDILRKIPNLPKNVRKVLNKLEIISSK